MKSPVFILAIGLMLPSFEGSQKPKQKITMNCGQVAIQVMLNMCERPKDDEVRQLCKHPVIQSINHFCRGSRPYSQKTFDSTKPNGSNIKMCGVELIKKLSTVCQSLSLSWRALPHLHDSFQASGDNEYSTETKMKMAQRLYVNHGIQQRQPFYSQQPHYSDYNQQKQMPGAFADINSQNEGDEIKQPVRSKISKHPKLTAKQLGVIRKCCSKGCSIKDLYRFCTK
ncbi:uncharacterized protein [Scyliorhinus torazame]|uniref:uncharacterized protein n=1 Tax=Scyliorhinus torazame TaxID=75743 RepID=UPI003B58B98E